MNSLVPIVVLAFAVVSSAAALTPEQTLGISRVSYGPELSADGNTAAYIAGDWTAGSAIEAFLPTGELFLAATDLSADPIAVLDNAHLPVWCHDGRLAVFQGKGESRQLIVINVTGDVLTSRPSSGEYSRKSATQAVLPPLWSADCSRLIVAEALLAQVPSLDAPFSVTSDDATVPFDRHFRDDTRWRIVSVDVAVNSARELLPPVFLDAMHLDGSVLLARFTDVPEGRFNGDSYRRVTRWHELRVADQPRLLGEEEARVLNGNLAPLWLSDASPGPYLIPPVQPDQLTLPNLSKPLYTAVDNREVLAVKQTTDGLLIHSRDLAGLEERVEFVASEGRRTLWEGGAALRHVTSAASTTAWVEAVPGGERVVFFRDGQRRAIDLPGIQAVTPEVISFVSESGTPGLALLYRPHEVSASLPLVVTAYGRLTDRRFQPWLEAQMHAARGIAYLAVDVAVRLDDLGAAYVDAVPAAVAAVRAGTGSDGPTGFIGGSLGGFAGLQLLQKTGIFDVAVLRAPPTEFAMSWATGKDRDKELLTFLMEGARPYEAPERYLAISPFWQAQQINAPVLFLHGTDDAQVPAAQSIAMFQALSELGGKSALRLYPGGDHSIVRGRLDYFLDYYATVFGWWDSYLK